jgi:hypothetical protein
MSRKLPIAFFVLIVCAAVPGIAEVNADTARFAEHLRGFRQYKIYEMSAAEYLPIRQEFVTWVDARVHGKKTIEQISEELAVAGLLLPKDADNPDALFESHAGFLGGVTAVPVSGAGGGDLLAISVGVYTGGCNFDNTVVLYDRKSFRKILEISAQSAYEHGYVLRALAAGKQDPATGRLVATGWVASNCSSNWNGEILRIDNTRRGLARNILQKDITAFAGEDMTIYVANNIVAFHYAGETGDGTLLIRPAVNRYRIRNGRAQRLAPIAVSYAGFIHEWLHLNDAEASLWATPTAAARHRELAAQFEKDAFDWRSAGDCPGSPPAREIGIEFYDSKQNIVFRIGGSTATELRMLSVSGGRSQGCREIDITGDLSGVSAELPSGVP